MSSAPQPPDAFDDEPGVSVIECLTWIGQGKWQIALTGLVVLLATTAYAFLSAPTFTARTSLLPPGTQQATNSAAAAMAALGQLGGASLGVKTPDELYVALLKSDSVMRELDGQYQLRDRYKATTEKALRGAFSARVRITSDKKSGVISVEAEDHDPAFAAELANGHAKALTRLLSRLAVSEAQQRRAFFEQQLNETKEKLINAEQAFRDMQEQSGVIVLEKQADALIGSAAAVRAQIAAREVQMKVLRTGATAQNPEVVRLASELQALRAELARMEANPGTVVPSGKDDAGSAAGSIAVTEMPVGRIPEAAIEFVRARRELKLQETMLESIVRQFEIAKLDVAKEGPVLQQIDVAMPPDAKSKPARLMWMLAGLCVGLGLGVVRVVASGLLRRARETDPTLNSGWRSLTQAWRWR